MAGNRPKREFMAGRGAKVAVWKNDKGYAITFQPPQYKNDAGEWKDGQIFQTDLPGIIHIFGRAQRFIEIQEEIAQE